MSARSRVSIGLNEPRRMVIHRRLCDAAKSRDKHAAEVAFRSACVKLMESVTSAWKSDPDYHAEEDERVLN